MTKSIRETNAWMPNRRQLLLSGAAAGAGLLLPRTARATDTTNDYLCNWQAGVFPNPASPQRVGYVTAFNGFGLSLAKDLSVTCGAKTATYAGVSNQNGNLKVAGVLETYTWAGDVLAPIHLEFHVSQANMALLKTAQQATLKTTTVSSLGYWIVNYDAAAKAWYEQAYPATPTTLTGVLNGGQNPVLVVETLGVAPVPGMDMQLYKVTLEIIPAPKTTSSLKFATSANVLSSSLKNWGIVLPARQQ